MLRHHPCSGAAGAPWPPELSQSSPSALLSGDKGGPGLWPRLKKWLQVENLKPIATPEPASSVTSWDLGGAAGKGGKGKGAEVQIMGLVMWEGKRRFEGEMIALVSGESRDANLCDVFPTKLGSFRASGVNWCYFHASFYVNCFGICLSQSPDE